MRFSEMTERELVFKASQVFAAKGSSLMSRLEVRDYDRVWIEYLDGLDLGIQRMGKLMAMLIQERRGHVRIPDNLLSESYLEMSRENAEKVVVLGLP